MDNHTYIFFRNLKLYSYIGIHDAEKIERQRILLNVKLHLNNTFKTNEDSISETLDYDKIRQNIIKLASSQHFNLQETLCEKIAQCCLQEEPVIAVEVSSEKPDIYKDCDGVGLRIFRQKC